MNSSLSSEVWKTIPRYEGLYEVSNLGRVRSLDRYAPNLLTGGRSLRKGKLLSPWLEKGYPRVALVKDAIHSFRFIHRLVAIAFVPKIKGKTHINHIDGKPGNNHFTNLEWCTPKENVHHAKYILNRIGGNNKLVIDLNTGIFYNSAKEAHTAKGFRHSLSLTVHQLNGRCTNKTTLTYL